MIETSDMENKQEFLGLVSHSLEVLEDGLVSETNRNSIKHGILETISKLFDQRDVATNERDNLRAALDDYQATINKWVDLCGAAEDRAKNAETRIGTLQALDISAQEIIRKLREDNRKYKKVCKALSDLYDACMQADGEGELYYTIDGDLLDAAREALVGEDASNATEE